MTVGVPGWIRANLFSSPIDGIITIVLGIIVAIGLYQSVNWVFFTASWEVVTSRVPLYVIGRYPQELYWRPETALLLFSVLLGMAWRLWGGIARGAAIVIVIITLLAGLLPYAGVDLGAPRYDASVTPDPPAVSPRETQRDISDADRANAIDQKDITTLSGTSYLAGNLDGDEDRSDYYSFTITDTKKLKTILAQQDADADLYLEDSSGNVLQSSTTSGSNDESITTTIDAGTYYLRVDSQQTANNLYVLSYSIADPARSARKHPVHRQLPRRRRRLRTRNATHIRTTFRNFLFTAAAFFIIGTFLIIGSSYIPGLEPVPTQDLGGLTLNLLLATIGIVCLHPRRNPIGTRTPIPTPVPKGRMCRIHRGHPRRTTHHAPVHVETHPPAHIPRDRLHRRAISRNDHHHTLQLRIHG